MGRVRVIFMGTPAFAVPSLKALIDAGFEVRAVVTQGDKPRGRGLAPLPSPVKCEALKHGIEVLEPVKASHPGFIDRLKALSPDFIAVVAYGKILPQAILDIPPKGCVNLHASLLPKYRGAAPINWAIINGDKEAGVTTMLMDKGMDTGAMLLKEKTAIGADDTAEDLFKRLSGIGAPLLVRTLEELWLDRIEPVPQDDNEATYAPMLKKEDGRVDWNKGAQDIKNLARGLYPWPGAYTYWNEKVLKIHAGKADPAVIGAPAPGTVAGVSKEDISVACGKGVFRITELQPENKRRMTAGEFAQGYRIKAGERFV
ncbi:MAG: methionyl-tRNA formyltransferase [Deltaproteobacteria bacterium]|nr:methionyl-tRNA formyltransferase [Deltaproteobacteria bacterium]